MKKLSHTNFPDTENEPDVNKNENITITPELVSTAGLITRAGESIEIPDDFSYKLQKEILAHAYNRQKEAHKEYAFSGRSVSRIGMMLAGAATMTIILLLILPSLLPTLNNLGNLSTPSPTANQTGFVNPTAQTPTTFFKTSPVSAPPLSFISSFAQAQSEIGGMFSKAQLTLNANLPDSPQESMVYEQQSDEKMTPERAKEIAASLGITGSVYQTSSEAEGEPIYHVTDGIQEIWFIGGANHFTYVADISNSPASSGFDLPLQTRVKTAEAFLKERGLLNFEYRVDETLSQGNLVVFNCLFAGIPLLETDHFNPHIEVQLDAQGHVAVVYYNLNRINPLGAYSIRSAEDAWKIILSNTDDKRVQYAITDPAINIRQIQPAWVRQYPQGELINLYGYLTIMQATEAGQEPWVTLGGFTLQGDLNDLIAAYEGSHELSAEQQQMISSGEVSEKQAVGWTNFFHVWGQIIAKADGKRVFQVEGWERSPAPDDYYFGTIVKENEKYYLNANDGKRWMLADIPADVPLNTTVSVRGVRVKDQPDLFNWSLIQVEPVEAPQQDISGGGGGPFNFSPTAGQTATETAPTPEPLPYQPGDYIDSMLGVLNNVEKLIYSDGRTEMHYQMNLPLPSDPSELRSVELIGNNLQGLETLNRLHIKVWGTYQIIDGTPTIEVERYEKAYKDEIIQAWLGKQKVETLDGRKVLLFTDINNKQYILSHSLHMPPEYLQDNFNGEQLIVEGVLSQEIYAGYPIINDFSGQIAPGRLNLDGYQLESNQVYEQAVEEPILEQDTVKDVIIDKVEMVYFAYDFSHGGGGVDLNNNPMRFVQPVWRFSGKLGDGRLVEVLVQAVADKYLQ
jgi:hypothetical protein